ncbi:hypothetical protein DL89DRAFT_260477 [Linderina pennispora]|uniref:DUF3533 domain-containing protein n=1 Tax=Linderina pennispora TaxID=61395 RepID=A0A1Y1VY73_9FUNG|nr:uncharacterized protein DL89DRAFT_260477 [Linderina pennispora]ORX66183.1 hypothetical protein DL89DRAFT_260477 [Linderina pennispora]
MKLAYWKYDADTDEGRVNLTDPSLRTQLKDTLKRYLRLLGFLTVLLWLILSIFFGANHKRGELVNRLEVDIFDFDQGEYSQEIVDTLLTTPSDNTMPTWKLNTRYQSLGQAKKYIKDDGWGGLVIMPGMSDRLNNALTTGANYSATDALMVLKQDSHHPLVQLTSIQPALRQAVVIANSAIATQLLQRLQESTSAEAKNNANVSTLLHPIDAVTVNLGPYGFSLSPLLAPLSLLMMFMCTLVPMIMLKFSSYPIYQAPSDAWLFVLRHAHLPGVQGIRTTARITTGSISIAGGFFAIWMTSWLTLLPMAFWLKSLVTFSTPEFIAMPFSYHYHSQASALVLLSSTSARLSSSGFQAMPFYQGTMLTRYIISGAHNRVGENLGVLFGELVFSLVLLYICTMIQQHQVHAGNVDRMGWRPMKAEEDTADSLAKDLERGKVPMYMPAVSRRADGTIQIAEDQLTQDVSMRNETVGV